jgi:UDP-N-acetylglucosamine 2-epimerase (non-hydrolysing)
MKIAPLMTAFSAHPGVVQTLVHTGQHYDDTLSRIFFDDLGIPRPDVHLGVGSGSHAAQTAKVMMAFEPVCLKWKPDLVVVVGDVNSTVACSLVAAKLGVRVAHVEAGLRSFDWTMPEEINRVVTDRLSDLLFTTERSANENLEKEGIPADRIHFVGNVMIDTLLGHLERARNTDVHERFEVAPGGYALVTLHRPSNVDSPERLGPVAEALAEIAETIPVLFPVHPRTRQRLETFGLEGSLGRVKVLEPLGYLEFLALMADAALVLTDSGGIQEETTVLGVPCLTARPNTERPVTLEQGTNRLVQPSRRGIVEGVRLVLAEPDARPPQSRIPDLWDGKAAKRIARIAVAFLEGG